MQPIIFIIMNISNWAATTNLPHTTLHQSLATTSSKNSTTKNMVLFPITVDPWAQFGPMLQLFLSKSHHPPQKDWCSDAPMQHLYTNGHQHHPVPLKSSPTLTFMGLIHNQPHTEHSLATLTQPQLLVYTQSNLWDSASPKPLAHFCAQQPVHSHFPYTQHFTYTHSSLWKIHTTYVGSFLN